jgi:cytochrome c-type biogenesis protein
VSRCPWPARPSRCWRGVQGAAALALLFGLNIPACAAPLLAAVLGSAAVAGAARVAQGFVTLALFGLALSLPLVLALLWAPARRALDRLAGLSGRVPVLVGLLFVGLGVWSVRFALFPPG